MRYRLERMGVTHERLLMAALIGRMMAGWAGAITYVYELDIIGFVLFDAIPLGLAIANHLVCESEYQRVRKQ